MPAAERVCPERCASVARFELLGCRVDGMRGRDGARVEIPAATMPTSQRIGAPAASASRTIATTPSEKARSATMSGMPQACTMRAATGAISCRQRREIDLRRDDLEGAARDLGRIADVVEHASFPLQRARPERMVGVRVGVMVVVHDRGGDRGRA